jgi:hypothetical protein
VRFSADIDDESVLIASGQDEQSLDKGIDSAEKAGSSHQLLITKNDDSAVLNDAAGGNAQKPEESVDERRKPVNPPVIDVKKDAPAPVQVDTRSEVTIEQISDGADESGRKVASEKKLSLSELLSKIDNTLDAAKAMEPDAPEEADVKAGPLGKRSAGELPETSPSVQRDGGSNPTTYRSLIDVLESMSKTELLETVTPEATEEETIAVAGGDVNGGVLENDMNLQSATEASLTGKTTQDRKVDAMQRGISGISLSVAGDALTKEQERKSVALTIASLNRKAGQGEEEKNSRRTHMMLPDTWEHIGFSEKGVPFYLNTESMKTPSQHIIQFWMKASVDNRDFVDLVEINCDRGTLRLRDKATTDNPALSVYSSQWKEITSDSRVLYYANCLTHR